MTKQSGRENNLTGTANYRTFLSEARKFFQRCMTYLTNQCQYSRTM